MASRNIVMNHGAGGRQMQDLISKIIVKRLNIKSHMNMDDASIINPPQGKRLAMTTDSFVVNPIFFPGGDIGRLCVAGTINDLLTAGAKPAALSFAIILEEGMSLDDLEKILDSVAIACKEANVQIITGDTKVVERGKGDKIYINTCGIGFVDEGLSISSHNAVDGDIVFITGAIGVHEVAMMKARNLLPFEVDILSDVAPLYPQTMKLLDSKAEIHVIKDPTRGGVGQALYEITEHSNCTITLEEELLPISAAVRGVCELAGFDPLYLANEGKFIIIAPHSSESDILKAFPEAVAIGIVTTNGNEKNATTTKPELLLKTKSGGIRKIGQLETIQLPRIC